MPFSYWDLATSDSHAPLLLMAGWTSKTARGRLIALFGCAIPCAAFCGAFSVEGRCHQIAPQQSELQQSFVQQPSPQPFALKDGDTVVFYGDSISAQHLYTKFVEEFVLTRYPALHIRFVNAGVPGDTAYGGYAGSMEQRVARDVAPFSPTVITVMLGMNDGGYGQPSPQIDAAFFKGYSGLLDALRKAAPGAAITLITPSPYDEITHGTEFPGYSHVVAGLAQDVFGIAGIPPGIGAKPESTTASRSETAGERPLTLADSHGPLVKALQRAKTQFPQLAPLIIPDRIHPSETGHWIIAEELLKSWRVNPLVSRVALDAGVGGARLIASERTTLTNLEKTNTGLKWTQLDEALPLPLDLDNAMTPVLLGLSETEQLDLEILRVNGLEPGQYQLLIDQKAIAVFSRDALQHGINLALYKTPMLAQSRGIDWTEGRRAILDQAQLILNAEVKTTEAPAVAEKKLQQAEDELASSIRTKLERSPHTFELRRQ